MNKRDINFGFDPEIFLVYNDTKDYDNFVGNEFVMSPAILHRDSGLPFLTPDPKHPVLAGSKRIRLVMDGVAVEINSAQPVKKGRELKSLLEEAVDMATNLANKYGYSISIKPVVNFDYQRFYTDEARTDVSVLQGLIFGCDRDEDAFDQDFSCEILDVSNHPYRYGGGHFHLSGIPEIDGDDFLLNTRAMAQLCALTAGNFSVVTAIYPELERLRSSYYGKAGKYRPQVYHNGIKGVEYRTPSNNWMNLSIPVLDQFLDMFRVAVDWYLDRKTGKQMLEQYLPPTLSAIKNSDKEMSTAVLQDMGLI